MTAKPKTVSKEMCLRVANAWLRLSIGKTGANRAAILRNAAKYFDYGGQPERAAALAKQADKLMHEVASDEAAVRLPPRRMQPGRTAGSPPNDQRRDSVFRFICIYKAANDGNSPTCREIGAACNITSTSVVNYYLRLLFRAGKIDWDGNKARGIRVKGGQWTYNQEAANNGSA